ncbi:MAG: L,D-transpeptidase/peptidoglycan binding protein [Acetatifactor sp.]|nr:L,D-transpeptidase/peptidoglycan binding protein [Acetatifactor sp.]
MKKKWIFIIMGSAACLGVLCFAGHRAATEYFRDRYAPNTWIDGVYCTGRTVEDVNQEMVSRLEIPEVVVEDANGQEYSYDLKNASFSYDYSEALTRSLNGQKTNGWMAEAGKTTVIDPGDAVISFAEEKVSEWWNGLPIVKAEETKPILEMKYDNDGYELTSTLDGHLEVNKGLSELVSAISSGTNAVNLKSADCYYDYEMTDAQKDTFDTWRELKAMEKCGLIYDMGAEQIQFDAGTMSKLIAKDEKGNPLKDENGEYYYDLEAADEMIAELCERYHTYGKDRELKTSRESEDVVTVPGGNFGTEIDVKAEQEYFREVLNDKMLRVLKSSHVPKYIHQTLVRGLDDIGGTYIEVDMTEQTIYFYKDGELLVTSGVVTGNLRTRHGTPEGVFCIQGKYKNRILRGPGYASFVRRWMPVYKGIGLHDANWRKKSEFGGETYKRNGSHGCVNMPDETTDIIFEQAEVGTPVLIFK